MVDIHHFLIQKHILSLHHQNNNIETVAKTTPKQQEVQTKQLAS